MPAQDNIWWLEDTDIFGGDTGVEGIDDDDELGAFGFLKKIGSALDPREHIKHIGKGVSSLARGDIKGALDPGGFLSSSKRRSRRPSRRSSRSSRGKGGWLGRISGSVDRAKSRAAKSAMRTRRSSRPTSRPMARSTRQSVGMPSGGDQSPVNLLIRALTAKQVVGQITKTPKLAMRRSGVSGGDAGNKRLAAMVARAVKKSLGGQIGSINKRLSLAANQRTATSEHLNINNMSALSKKVLVYLLRISANLTSGDATLAGIRRVGLMSVLL